jgi:hypothetical protein
MERHGPGLFLAPSPSLLRLLADALAKTVAAHLGKTVRASPDDTAMLQLLRRGRGLIAQGAGRLLIHELGLAMSSADEAGLAGRLRVGAPARTRRAGD